MNLISRFLGSKKRKSNQDHKRSTKTRLRIEPLEARALLTCSVISGYVYQDANNNGLFDGNESPIAFSTIELRNSSNVVVGTTTTNGAGYYEFEADETVDTDSQQQSHTITFADFRTNSTQSQTLPKFNPDLGTLNSVEILINGHISSEIKVENLDPSSVAITGTVTGSLTLTGPHFNLLVTTSTDSHTFFAAGYDGISDFGGTSGVNFGVRTVNGSANTVLTSAAALLAYTGTGSITINELAEANSSASGGGNLLASIASLGGATVTVRYNYTPDNCLQPGNYTIIQKFQPNGYLDGKESRNGNVLPNTIGSDQITVTLGNTDKVNNNFGELLAAQIGGNVYVDLNNNGQWEMSEAPIAGVSVNLSGTDDMGLPVNHTQLTLGSGAYLFTGLRPGNYTITETQPSQYLDGKDTLGNLTGTVGNDQFFSISLLPGQSGVNYNFGELPPASIGGWVYVDLNNNGFKDGGENGIGSVNISLSGINDLGQPVSLSQQTQGSGAYQFTGLRPGNYTITETQPSQYLDGRDSLGSLNGIAGNDVFSSISLLPNQAGVNYNFGELQPAEIGGYVYVDNNNNGWRESGEAPIAFVTVSLSGVNDLGSSVFQSQQTLGTGAYLFSNLRPGTYTITETQPGAYLDGKETIGSLNGAMANDVFSNITLLSSQSGVNYNFGELQPAQIGGNVYVDLDNDGNWDAGEAAIGGVSITLNGMNDIGSPVTAVVTTLANGAYLFTNLRPGNYSITETQPAAYLDGKDSLGNLSGSLANDAFNNISLFAGQAGTNYNFGELPASSIAGWVYQDSDDDGFKDSGEIGIAGVLVTLTGTNNLGVSVNLTATTAADGSYSFVGLRQGNYTLTEQQPIVYSDGKDREGSSGGVAGNDIISSISLGAGVDAVNYNFGEVRPGSICGLVYLDKNNNGRKDRREIGLVGVTITLSGLDIHGASVQRTTTTEADGSYCFMNLPAGTYKVSETQPEDFKDGKDTRGTLGGTAGNDQFSDIVVGMGQEGKEYNFGERPKRRGTPLGGGCNYAI